MFVNTLNFAFQSFAWRLRLEIILIPFVKRAAGEGGGARESAHIGGGRVDVGETGLFGRFQGRII